MPRALISAVGSEEQQFVRAVATEDHAGRQVPPEQVDDRQQRPVAGRVAVRLVEQPEVVDVDERDRERGSFAAGRRPRTGRLRRPGRRGSRCRSTDRAGSSRSSAWVWRVIRPCAERKTRNRTNAATRAADRVTMTMFRRTSSSWARIGTASRQTPTMPDDLPVEAEREVLAHDRRGRERGTAGVARGDIDDVDDGRVAGGRPRERSRRGRDHSPEGRIVGEDDRPVRSPDLDAQDGSRRDERSAAGVR